MCCQEHADKPFLCRACVCCCPSTSCSALLNAQSDIAEARTYAIGGVVTITGIDQRPRAGQHPLPAGRHGGRRGVPGQQLGARSSRPPRGRSAGDRTLKPMVWLEIDP